MMENKVKTPSKDSKANVVEGYGMKHMISCFLYVCPLTFLSMRSWHALLIIYGFSMFLLMNYSISGFCL
jgi:hypothetical protein